jgi:hypothetical protein
MRELKILLGLIVFLSVTSCEEVGPDINLGGNSNAVSDTTYVITDIPEPEKKVVVMEEFTGVRCVNCPEGHEIIEALKGIYPDRFIYASFHSNFLSNPYLYSRQDFRLAEAQDIEDYLISVGFKPAAAIDRKIFDATVLPSILYGRQTWNNYVGQVFNEVSKANVGIAKTYNESTRELEVAVTVTYTQSVSAANKVTVLLTEDSIVSPQIGLNDVMDTFYVHNGVFRKFLSATRGDILDADKEAGRVFRKVYRTTIDNAWIAEHIKVMAYVHEFEADSKRIYQGKQVKMKN